MIKRQNNNNHYDQLLGKKGVVYILANDALAANLFKIGASQRSGTLRAHELNHQATTGLPAEYKCLFECATLDCGRSEREIHEKLADFRRGRFGSKSDGSNWGQEFFEITDLEAVKRLIIAVCDEINQTTMATQTSALPIHSAQIQQHPSVQRQYEYPVATVLLNASTTPSYHRRKRSKPIKIFLYLLISYVLFKGVTLYSAQLERIWQTLKQTQTKQAINLLKGEKLPNITSNTDSTPIIQNQNANPLQLINSLLKPSKHELPKAHVISKTNEAIHIEWVEQGKPHKRAGIIGNRQRIIQQFKEAKKPTYNSGYYGQYDIDIKEKASCEFKTVMTNEEIKNCQN